MPNKLKLRQPKILKLHPNEAELILLLREKVRFGSVEIVAKDGLPVRITRRVEDYSCTVDNFDLIVYEKHVIIPT